MRQQGNAGRRNEWKIKMNSQIDQIDHAILGVLSVDGRISVTDLAERVGLSKTPCHLRLKRLQSTGYITGIKAVLDRSIKTQPDQGLEYVALWNSAFLASEDLMEAFSAFMQKRDPSFQGK